MTTPRVDYLTLSKVTHCSLYKHDEQAFRSHHFQPFIAIGMTSTKLNSVVFVVDDLGIADVDCFGDD